MFYRKIIQELRQDVGSFEASALLGCSYHKQIDNVCTCGGMYFSDTNLYNGCLLQVIH